LDRLDLPDFEFAVFDFPFELGLPPTPASTFALTDAFGVALVVLFSAELAVDCAPVTALLAALVAPLALTLPLAEPFAEPAGPETVALPLPDPDPFAADCAVCAVLLALDWAALLVPVAVFDAVDESAFACASACAWARRCARSPSAAPLTSLVAPFRPPPTVPPSVPPSCAMAGVAIVAAPASKAGRTAKRILNLILCSIPDDAFFARP
jgi:hypothetical protein